MMRALDLAEAVAEEDITPAAVLELCLEAIAEREKDIRAFARLDADAARIEASRAVPREGLFGLPVAFKDNIDTAHLATEYGSPIYRDHRPKADAAIVVRAELLGGIVLGKTAMAEFAFAAPPETCHPCDPERTPGMSSAGSAAAVGAGMVPLALGTQTGGSVILPASYCGVAAVKPSYRLLPMQGVKPFAPLLDTMGLFGARVADVAFGLEGFSGRPMRVDGRDFGTPRFGVLRQEFAGEADASAMAALDRAIRCLEKAGARVEDIAAPGEWPGGLAAHRAIMLCEMLDSLAFEWRHCRGALSPDLHLALSEGEKITREAYDDARRGANHARKASRAVFEDVDAVITYAAPGEAPPHGQSDGEHFNRLPTLLGLPAVNVPGLSGALGLPVGIQVLGRFGDDHRALAAAAFLEAAILGGT